MNHIHCKACSQQTSFHKGILFFFFGFLMLVATASITSVTYDRETATIVDALRTTLYPSVAMVSPTPAVAPSAIAQPARVPIEPHPTQSLSITRFSPLLPASYTTIYGTGFGSAMSQSDLKVYLGGKKKIPASVLFRGDNRISIVPGTDGNNNGYITVELTDGSSVVSANSITVPTNIANPSDLVNSSFAEYVVPGDVDGNGKIGTTDLSLLRAFLSRQISLTDRQRLAADVYPTFGPVDQDGNTNYLLGDGQINEDDFDLLRAVSQAKTQLANGVVIRSFAPFVGKTGTIVRISGLGFRVQPTSWGGVSVFFGGDRRIPAPSVRVVDDKTIEVEVPSSLGRNLNGYLTISVNHSIDYTTKDISKNVLIWPSNVATYPDFVRTGDIDGNGFIDAKDLTLMVAILAKQIKPTDRQRLAADVYPEAVDLRSMPGDGIIDSNDKDLLLKMYQTGDSL